MSTLGWVFTVGGILVVGVLFLSLLDWLGDRRLEAARRSLELQGKRRVGL